MRTAKWRFVAALTLVSAPVLVAQTAPSWTEQFPPTSPAPRVYQSMAYDSAHGQVVMFGGQDFTGNVGYTDTWVWDGSTWTQKFPQHSPPAQSAHAMVYDSAHGRAVMFSLNDTWLWDGSQWTPVPPMGPSGRYGHAMAYDSAHSQVVMSAERTQTTTPSQPSSVTHGYGTAPPGRRNFHKPARRRGSSTPWLTTPYAAKWFCSVE